MRNLFEELRYRNVFRVGIAYAVVGWVLAQVADLIVDAFNLPDTFLQMIIIVLLLGFPVALFLAWAFELTPEGVKKAKDLPEDMPKDPRAGRRLNAVIIVMLVIAVAWLGWDKLQQPVIESSTNAATATEEKSIAVLPFADFSPDSDHAWFADGLTDEILNALARTRSLRVASRTSSFAYRDTDQDATTIAKELDVAHILEGSVRRAGDRIRVTAQLIRASDDAHLWSDTFDASSVDSIEIQEQIAFDIASLLDTAMDPAELRRMVAAGTESIAAWEAYVQMREEYLRSVAAFDTTGSSEKVLELYREIVALDPAFGEAHLLFAEIVDGWLSPAAVTMAPPRLSADELQALFRTTTADAARHARNEDDRLGAEVLRARQQLRLSDQIDLTRERLQYHADSRGFWAAHLQLLLVASRFDDAAVFVREGDNHDFGNNNQLSTWYALAARIDIDAALAGLEVMLAPTSPVPADLYQAHRILLMANRVDEAADVGRRYISVATNPTWSVMIRIRQACAEGRYDDAEQLYEEYDFSGFDPANNNIQWLALKTLGRNEEAVELLRPLDQPSKLVRLSELLSYTHFDPAPFPNLAKRLEEQGIMRYDVTPMNFACKR
jgi:TolB-like protein